TQPHLSAFLSTLTVNPPAAYEPHPLSLHDALPIFRDALAADLVMGNLDQALSDPTGYEKCDPGATDCFQLSLPPSYASVLRDGRSEEHTSELQSRENIVCRLLLEKKIHPEQVYLRP